MDEIETESQKSRRRFVFGALEQLANIFGAITASVLTVGLFLPAIGALSGAEALQRRDMVALAVLVLGLTSCTAVAALVLRGLARQLENAPGRLSIRRGRSTSAGMD